MKTYILHHVSLWSMAKIGFLIGWVASFFPIALVAFTFFKIVSILLNWLSSMVYHIKLPLPGNFGFDVNVIELLKLQDFVNRLNTWAAIGFFTALLIVIFITTVIALFWGMIAVLSGLVFNLVSKAIGGIELEATEEVFQSQALPAPPMQ